jgi:hypothetical protein
LTGSGGVPDPRRDRRLDPILASDYVDALEDDPDEDFEGYDTTAVVVGDLRFSVRIVNKIAARHFTPDDVSRIYANGVLEPSNMHLGFSVAGRHRGRPARIAIEPIAYHLEGEENVTYNVRNAFYTD